MDEPQLNNKPETQQIFADTLTIAAHELTEYAAAHLNMEA